MTLDLTLILHQKFNSTYYEFGIFRMPSPNRNAAVSTCVELDSEQSYNKSDILSYVENNIFKLTSEQKNKDIYDKIMHCVDNNIGEIFILDAPGGTGISIS